MEATIISSVVSNTAINAISTFGGNKLTKLFSSKENINVNLEDVLRSRGGQEAARIGLDFIKRNNGIPNEDVYKVLKSMLLKLWKTSETDDDFNRLQYYAEIIKKITPLELHVLITAFKVTKKPNYVYSDGFENWIKYIIENSTISYRELVITAMEGLDKKKLLEPYNSGGFNAHPSQIPRNSLTKLGYSLIEFVYDEMDGDLTLD